MKSFPIILILSLFIQTSVWAERIEPQQQLITFAGNIHQFNQIFPQEKVYLHFDNTSYFSGETIWFKAFVVNASTLQRSASTVLYVDLLSPSGLMLQRLKLKVRAGQADGSFTLMDASTEQARQLRGILPYPSGFYEIRAYTQFMMNFSQDAVFSRVFPVYQKPETDGDYANRILTAGKWTSGERPSPPKTDDINISFYPEGGHLVRDMECRVAFKATDSNGQGIDGTLTFQSGGKTITAETLHDGMGDFVYTPSGLAPRASFSCADRTVKVSLPGSENSGYTIFVTQPDFNKLTARIRRGNGASDKLAGLTVTCRGEVYHYSLIHLNENQEVNVELDTGNWPLGVCNMTLFNPEGYILATRALFHSVGNFSPPQISVKTDRNRYSSYQKISMDLKLTDGRDGTPFKDRFCISVRDAADYGTAFSGNILTDFLLSSDLKGCISNPEFYFQSDDETRLKALDLLMMVQGWSTYSRYDWKIMSGASDYYEQRRMEDSLSVNGWILSNRRKRKEMLKSGVSVFVTIQPQGSDKVEWARYTTEDIGYFGFNLKDYYGPADLLMLVEREESDGVYNPEPKARIKLERALVPEPRRIQRAETWTDREHDATKERIDDVSEPPYLTGSVITQDGLLLPEVTIRERRRYIDYFTFHALDVEKDVETELDLGNYPPDVLGYLLKKGYSGYYDPGKKEDEDDEAFYKRSYFTPGQDDPLTPEERPLTGQFLLDGIPVFWYVHNSNEFLYQGEYEEPWTLDTRDITGILVFDSPAPLAEIRESVPFYMKLLRSHNVMPAILAMNGGISTQKSIRYYLIDVQVKEDARILSNKAKRNLGQRITTMQGFTPQRAEFYSPQYPEGPIEGDVDYRRTLYWNPNVITDEEGNAHVEFYNNSYSTNFTVTGAGITASGTPYVLDADF